VSIDVVRYVATRDLKAGDVVSAVFVGQLDWDVEKRKEYFFLY
jgi:hypothetical protein